LAAESGNTLLMADLDHCPAWRTEPAAIASLLVREVTLSDAMLLVSGLKTSAADEDAAKSFLATLTDYPGMIVIASESPSLAAIARGFLNIPFTLPNYDTRRALWQRLTTEAGITVGPGTLVTLANNFLLAPEQIAAAVNTARQRLEWRITAPNGLGTEDAAAELRAAARRQSGAELAALTTKVEPFYSWTDIVLAEDSLQQLKESAPG
jgi:hypothetical protein